MATSITIAASALALRLAELGLARHDQDAQLVGIYRRHSRVRRLLIDAGQAASERARKQGPRDEAAVKTEVERASAKAARDAKERHGWTGDGLVSAELVGDAIVSIVAAIAATAAVRGLAVDAEAVRLVADQVAFHDADHCDAIDRVSTPDPATGGSVVSSTGYDYLVESLHSKENAPQRLLVHTMLLLEYSKPEIRRVLSEARGEPVDDASVRKLVKRIGSPNSAPMA